MFKLSSTVLKSKRKSGAENDQSAAKKIKNEVKPSVSKTALKSVEKVKTPTLGSTVKLESGKKPTEKLLALRPTSKSPKGKKASKTAPLTVKKETKAERRINRIKTKVQKKIAEKRAKFSSQSPRGVVYFSRLPHGFYERELKSYCSQFGTVTNLYYPRSDNGNSRGYAFVEFLHPEVAEIVADTMNNYLMFKRLIKAKYIPPEEQRPWVFRFKGGTKQHIFEKKKEAREERERHLTDDEEKKAKQKAQIAVKRASKKLKSYGIESGFQVTEAV